MVQPTDTAPNTAHAGSPPPGSRSALLIVFLVVFIDLLGFGIVLPLLPLYASELIGPLWQSNDATARLQQGILLGVLMASFSAMQFLFAPVWGRISDRIGRRPILLLGLVGSVIFYSLFGVASALGAHGRDTANRSNLLLAVVLLFVARLGAGLAGATIATAQAVIADCTPPDRRARGMALIGAAFGIGFTFGPLFGFASLFVESGGAAAFDQGGTAAVGFVLAEGSPGFAAAALSLIATLLALGLLPETLKPGLVDAHLRRGWLDRNGLFNVLRTPSVGVLVVTFFLATFAFGSLESTLALVNKLLLTGAVERQIVLNREALRTTEQKNFLVFAYVGFVLMLIQGLIYQRLVQRVGEVRFLRFGVALMAVGLLGAVVVLAVRPDKQPAGTPLLLTALGAMTLAVSGFAFLTPSVQALISRRSDPARQGEVLGVNQSAAALARILGPFLGLTLFFVTPGHEVPFACGAALLAVVSLLSLRVQPQDVGMEPGKSGIA